MNILKKTSKIISLKKGESALSVKKDLKTVISYIESVLRADLNRRRFNQKMGTDIDFSDDVLLNQAQQIINSVVNDIDEINKRTELQKNNILKEKNTLNAVLSPDENYAIDITAMKDIKKAGLSRMLSKEESQKLKQAGVYVSLLYSEQAQMYKERNHIR